MLVYTFVLVLVLPILVVESGFNAFKFEQSGNVIIVERFELASYNKDYIKNISIVTFKYNRTCTAVNATGYTILEIGNNVEIVIQAYKFLSNEYRMFPIHFQINACDALQENAVGVKNLYNCGNFRGCPFRKVYIYEYNPDLVFLQPFPFNAKLRFLQNTMYHVCNFVPDESKFPPLIPEGKYKVELNFVHRSGSLVVLNCYVSITRPIPIPK